MAVAIRGTTPASTITVSNPVSLTLNGTRQPQSGDVLLIVHANDFYALSNMPTPTVGGSSAGVTAVTGGSADGGTNGAHAIAYTYNVGSTGDLTVAVTETGSADEEKAFVVYVLSGVDTGTPVDVAGNATNTGATTHICPSVSPTSSDAFLICHTNPGGGAAPASYTHPSGMTETLDTVSGGLALGGAILQLSASGATGTKTFTPSNSVTASANLSIAIKTGGAAAAPESSAYSPARLPGRIGPDRKVYLPRPRFDTSNGAVAEITGTTAETQDNQTSTASGVLSYSGTATETQDNQTSTASGVLGYTGTVAETQDDQTSTASGSVSGAGITGSLAETQDNQTSTTTGVLGYSGTSARTQANQTSTATGILGYTGTSARTQANQTSTATGVLGYTGTSARTQANQTSTASGTFTPPGAVSGSLAETQDNQTATATGILGYTGTSARTQGNQTSTATGWITITGTVTVVQANQVAAASGLGGAIDPTPVSRTHNIPADTRTTPIEADIRSNVITADIRTVPIETDTRSHAVPADTRILVAPSP